MAVAVCPHQNGGRFVERRRNRRKPHRNILGALSFGEHNLERPRRGALPFYTAGLQLTTKPRGCPGKTENKCITVAMLKCLVTLYGAPGGGVLPIMGYTGMLRPKGVPF